MALSETNQRFGKRKATYWMVFYCDSNGASQSRIGEVSSEISTYATFQISKKLKIPEYLCFDFSSKPIEGSGNF